MKILVITDIKKIGSQLKAERENQHLTVKHVSVRSGVHINTIWRIEKGEGIPRLDCLELWARALGFVEIIFTL